MNLEQPAPISAYFAAKNVHDIDAMLAPFAADAEVRDEGENHVGHTAIRAWMEHTTRKYKVTSTPEEATKDGDKVARWSLASSRVAPLI
jgi:ketosteroid isomerase-like protein